MNVTVSDNNPKADDPVEGIKRCYKHDVVFGTITNFQFDYLRHQVLLLKTKGQRYTSTVIIDQADNVVIDNAAHTARLSDSIAGFGTLKNVFLSIWIHLDQIQKEMQNRLKKEITIENITEQQKKELKNNLMKIDITRPFPNA